MPMHSPFADIATAIDEMRSGRMIIVVDDEDRENEGDLTMAAEMVTPEAVNFMAKFGRGLICLAMTPQRLDFLGLGLMSAHNSSRFGTAFTESIDALGRGVTTGISAYDRSETIRCAIDPATEPADLGRPGHIFPLRAQPGGVLVRPGQTEAGVDLARLAGLKPAGVICEIMNDDGSMARVPDLVRFSSEHGMKMITVAELIRYRLEHDCVIHKTPSAMLPTKYGPLSVTVYGSDFDEEPHVALVFGEPGRSAQSPLVRLHSRGDGVSAAFLRIAAARGGVLIGRRSEICGPGEYRGEDHGVVGVFEQRPSAAIGGECRHADVLIAARILRDLGVDSIRLLSNSPEPVAGLCLGGVNVVEYVSLPAREPALASKREERMLIGAD